MDNFMDRLAQKFGAQEIVRANSHAEAEEMKRLKLQMSEYEKILQEMRKLNYKNAELCEKFDRMVRDDAGKIRGMKEDGQKLIAALRDLTKEQARNREAELARLEEERVEREQAAGGQNGPDMALLDEMLEDKFKRSDDFVHKESVKVYRNVQAVVADELKKSMEKAQGEREALKDLLKDEMACRMKELKGGMNGRINMAVTFSAISMIASLGCALFWALTWFGIVK